MNGMIPIFAETNTQPVPRYFLELSFKGTRYHGWQVQKNALSVQEFLNNALKVLLKEEIETTGAGRTDTGVHARYFVAHFDCTREKLNDNKKFLSQLNQILPEDISILGITRVKDTAHARFDAISRTYEYYITTVKDPFMDEYAWYLKKPPDPELMAQAAEKLLAIEDFTSFSKLHSNSKTNLCKVSKATWEEKDGLLVFTITADRFLRNMVRAIVGTLVNVGRGKTSMDEFEDIINSKNRSKAGQSVPGKGLFLVDIEYPGDISL